MANLERSYVIPLRKDVIKVPKYYRSKRAISVIGAFVMRHMKVSTVKIGKHLNEEIWKHGIKNPPMRVKVHIVKEDDKALVELEGFKFETSKVQTQKAEPKTFKEKLQDVTGAGKEEKEEEAPKEKEQKKVSPKSKSPEKKTKRAAEK